MFLALGPRLLQESCTIERHKMLKHRPCDLNGVVASENSADVRWCIWNVRQPIGQRSSRGHFYRGYKPRENIIEQKNLFADIVCSPEREQVGNACKNFATPFTAALSDGIIELVDQCEVSTHGDPFWFT